MHGDVPPRSVAAFAVRGLRLCPRQAIGRTRRACGQDDRHRLRMNRRHDGVTLSRQEAEKFVPAFDRALLGPRTPRQKAHRPCEGEDGPILGKGEPSRRLARLGILVFSKRCRRNQATVLLTEPSSPVRAAHVADVRDGCAAVLRRAGHVPARHGERPAS
jgi:hypothetical protein